ncbi:hypothetical protein GO003_006325 [Methylicorpusculum oleiharenae]|uniref:hypothetical protein n=1 Tax=Methylicorpusculum oleiharenae TaxID=1338687 RepID=UPI00135AFE5C|nr:hypothetical protein [Methylicorpusculum oleiharenae]MCD2450000.1 hypothetical protein [Methylicorpusculum oleiharenae]
MTGLTEFIVFIMIVIEIFLDDDIQFAADLHGVDRPGSLKNGETQKSEHERGKYGYSV